MANESALADSRTSPEAFVRRLDARLALDNATGYVFAAVCALLCGFSLREVAERLNLPATSLSRRLRLLAGKEVEA